MSTIFCSYIFTTNSSTGICSTVSGHDRVCTSALGIAPADLAKKLSLPADIIQHVLALQSSVSLALPALSGILIFVGVIAFLVAWFSTGENSVKTRRRWMATTRIILWSAVGSSFAAAYLLTFSISAMEVIVPKSSAGLAITRGQTLQILQWMVFSFTALYVSTIHYMLHKIVKEAREGVLPKFEFPSYVTPEITPAAIDDAKPATKTAAEAKPTASEEAPPISPPVIEFDGLTLKISRKPIGSS